jgi:hypothetical protein
MYGQRQVIGFSQIAGDRDHITNARIAERTCCACEDQRRTHFSGGFHHDLHGFKVVYVEGRNGKPFTLCF